MGFETTVRALLEIVHLLGHALIAISVVVGMVVLDGAIHATAFVPLISKGLPPEVTVSLEVVHPLGHTLLIISIQAGIEVPVGALQRYPVTPLKTKEEPAPILIGLLALIQVPEQVFIMISTTPR